MVFLIHAFNTSTGTVIFKAKVQDNDTGLDGFLTFTLQNAYLQDRFYLDSVNGRLILISSLDREVKDSYNITIIVRDGSDSPKTSNVTVYINVVDVNDNAPVCETTLFSLQLPESK